MGWDVHGKPSAHSKVDSGCGVPYFPYVSTGCAGASARVPCMHHGCWLSVLLMLPAPHALEAVVLRGQYCCRSPQWGERHLGGAASAGALLPAARVAARQPSDLRTAQRAGVGRSDRATSVHVTCTPPGCGCHTLPHPAGWPGGHVTTQPQHLVGNPLHATAAPSSLCTSAACLPPNPTCAAGKVGLLSLHHSTERRRGEGLRIRGLASGEWGEGLGEDVWACQQWG